MRLDLFVKASRIILRRTQAKELCDAGKIRLNAHPAKAASEVRPGDTIEVALPLLCRRYRVDALPEGRQVSREKARGLATLLEEQREDDLF